MAIRYAAELTAEDMVPALERVKCQTLVLHSEVNFYASEQSARLAAASVPGASLVTFQQGLTQHITELLDTLADFIAPANAAAEQRADSAMATNAADDTAFTVRELEILALLARGLSNKEMADRLTLSPRTVERHLENVYRKGGFRNRSEATAYAYTNGLVER